MEMCWGLQLSLLGGCIQHRVPEEDPSPARCLVFKGSLRAKLVSSGRTNGSAPQEFCCSAKCLPPPSPIAPLVQDGGTPG